MVIIKSDDSCLSVILLIIEPGAPQNVKATAISYNQIKLQWEPPIQSSGSLTGYAIYQVLNMQCSLSILVKQLSCSILQNVV